MAAQTFHGFPVEALQSLATPGIGDRWAAVQERLHPLLASLSEDLAGAAQSQFAREWPLYEISWKTARYLNRGRGRREPIAEYHFAVDRPPRGAGIYVGVSGEERSILVGLNVWGARKQALRRVWESGGAVWRPLVTAIPEARFSGSRREGSTWLDDYLRSEAQYLWCGWVYSWDDPAIASPAIGERLIEAVLWLLPLNEAVMEEAENLEWSDDLQLREQPAAYLPSSQIPSFETIAARIAARGFTYDDQLLRAYHVALQTKPLAILPGISGTGKTRLTRLYADAVHDIRSDNQPNPFYLLVAVQPDWHNARDLLGYYNGLTGHFHATAFLRFLHQAASDPRQLYYVCLDELNLARPEYYLAPILSGIETVEHLLDLGAPAATVTMPDGLTLRNPFRLPLNVAITGTVNVDESTFALSDKLLDRANVIELSTVDLEGFRRAYSGPIEAAAWSLLVELHRILSDLGQPFGYRTVAEILRYLDRGRDVLPMEQALDLQIKQKILPKIRGEDSSHLRRALGELLAALTPADRAASQYPESAAKLRRMRERLEREGYTDFYG